jgi:hypothetical protein
MTSGSPIDSVDEPSNAQCYICDLLSSSASIFEQVESLEEEIMSPVKAVVSLLQSRMQCSVICEEKFYEGTIQAFEKHRGHHRHHHHHHHSSTCKTVMTFLHRISGFLLKDDNIVNAIKPICDAYEISDDFCSITEQRIESFMMFFNVVAHSSFCGGRKGELQYQPETNSLKLEITANLTGKVGEGLENLIFCSACKWAMNKITKEVDSELVDLDFVEGLAEQFCMTGLVNEESCKTMIKNIFDEIKNGVHQWTSDEICYSLSLCQKQPDISGKVIR